MKRKEVKETKVVYNACHGGYRLSDAACQWLADRGLLERYTVHLNPETYERVTADWRGEDGEEPMEYSGWQSTNPAHLECCPLWEDHIPRHHPLIVQVVEEMGEAASGDSADLQIAVVRGNRYRIGEYDGKEWVETPHDILWEKIG